MGGPWGFHSTTRQSKKIIRSKCLAANAEHGLIDDHRRSVAMGDREDWRARGVLGLKALGAAVLLRHRHVQCKSIDNLGLDAEVNFKAATQSSKSRATGSPSHCSNKHCTAVEVGSGNRFRWRSYQSYCHKPLHPPPSYSLNPPLPKGQPCASITCTAVSTFGAYSPECGQASAPRSAKQRCGMTSLGRRSIQTCSRSTEPALLNPGSE